MDGTPSLDERRMMNNEEAKGKATTAAEKEAPRTLIPDMDRWALPGRSCTMS